MSQRQDYMKRLISDSFKQLLQEYPFEKITVKMLTDRTGIIRSTFYHHFQDKLDVLDWIVQQELIEPMRERIQQDQIKESLQWTLSRIIEDSDFYHRAIRISGKNGFEDVVNQQVSALFLEEIQRRGMDGIPGYPLLDANMLARYYAFCFIHAIMEMMTQKSERSAEEILRSYEYLMNHSLTEILMQAKPMTLITQDAPE